MLFHAFIFLAAGLLFFSFTITAMRKTFYIAIDFSLKYFSDWIVTLIVLITIDFVLFLATVKLLSMFYFEILEIINHV